MQSILQSLVDNVQVLQVSCLSVLLSNDQFRQFAEPIIFVVRGDLDSLIDFNAKNLAGICRMNECDLAVGTVLEEGIDTNEGSFFLLLEVKLPSSHQKAIDCLVLCLPLLELSLEGDLLVQIVDFAEGLRYHSKYVE